MVLHEWAYEWDSDEFVHISNSVRSTPYRCTQPGCGLQVRRRAGTKEPHFYHLNPSGDVPCEGGEGPRHKKAKNWILDMCSKDSKVTYCAEEIRIGRKYADVFIQTDLGPFYIEVIDSHPPESTRWEELEHRIIPFWIDRFREQDADGFEFMVHHDFGEIFSMHFGMICDKVNQLRRGGSIEETWFKHMERILSAVEDIHRDAKSNPPWYGGNDFVTTFVYAKNHPDYDKIVSGYKAASRRLLSR